MKLKLILITLLLPLVGLAQTKQTGGIGFTPQWNFKISGSDTTWQFGNTLMSPNQFPYFLTKWQSDQRYARTSSTIFSNRIIYAKQWGAALNSNINSGGGTNDAPILQRAIDSLTVRGGGTLVIDGVALINSTLVLKSNVKIQVINGGGVFLAPNSNCHMLTTVLTGQTVSNYNVSIEGGVWNGNCDNQNRWVGADSVSYGRQWVFGMWLGSMNGYSLKNVTMRNSKTFGITLSQSYNGTADNTTFIWDNTATFFNNHDSFHLWGTLDRLIINGVNSTGGDDDVIAFNTDECMPGTTDGEFEGPERGTTSAGITNVTVMNVNAHLNGRALRFIGYGTPGAYVDNINLYNFSGDVSYGMNWTDVDSAGRISIQGWNVTDPGGQSQINIAGGCESLSLSDIAGGTPVVLGTIVNKSGDYFSQPALVSGTNIKTVNSTTLLGSGDIPFPTSLPPSGTAGGDLTGTYPNPTVNTINSITKSYYDPTSSIQTQLNSKYKSGDNISVGTAVTTGSVGVGTPTPLAIAGFTVLEAKGTGSGLLGVSSAAGSAYGRIYSNGSVVIAGTSNAFPFVLDYNDTEKMRVVSGGIEVTGSVKSSSLAASQLVVTDGSKVLVSSAALPSGTTAETQSAGDNSTKVATTAYVDRGTNGTPTIILGAGATGTIGIAGNNIDGVITFTGTYTGGGSDLAIITMGGGFSYATKCTPVISSIGSSAIGGWGTSSGATTTTWTIVGVNSIPISSTYAWTYHNGGY